MAKKEQKQKEMSPEYKKYLDLVAKREEMAKEVLELERNAFNILRKALEDMSEEQ